MTIPISRREMLRTAAVASGVWATAGTVLSAQSTSPNEKLNIAAIGVGGRGAADVGGVSSENIENPALSAKDNHGWWLHNCKVTPQYNSDGSIRRYVLYFINVKKGSVAGTSWVYSDDLSPGSWYGQHSQFTKEAKFNNPALLFYPDGSAYGLSQSNDPGYPDTGRHLFAYRTKDFRAHSGNPDERWGPPLPNSRGTLNQLPGDVDHEDACIWEVNNQYHAIMTDMSGRATGGKKKAVMHWFADAKSGSNYRLYSDVSLAYVHDPVQFQEGDSKMYYRMERPNVYVNPDTGAVEAFLLACVPREASQSAATEGAGIIIWPVENWKPADSVAMPHVRALARDVTSDEIRMIVR